MCMTFRKQKKTVKQELYKYNGQYFIDIRTLKSNDYFAILLLLDP